MVSQILVEALAAPSDVVTSLYTSWDRSEVFPKVVEEHFGKLFSEWDAFSQIPPLDRKHSPTSHGDRGLVRFRCMIQDTSTSPEVYLEEFNNGRCGGWGVEESEEDTHDEIDYGKLRERGVIWAVTVPGETDWFIERVGSGHSVKDESAFSCSQRHKLPGDDPNDFGISLKIYHDSSDTYRPGNIHTFVGILTDEESHNDITDETKTFPTLHVLFEAKPESSIPLTKQSTKQNNSDERTSLVQWLADYALGGDVLVAEWTLLFTLGKVHSRVPPLLPISFTISNLEESQQPALLDALRLLLPLVSPLPLSLSFLNERSFFPESKNEELSAGRLQLPPKSTVIVTEFGITEGTVTERGLKNITALQSVMSTQTLSYVFPFSSYTFQTDLKVLVLASGKKSTFFQTDLNLSLKPTKETSKREPSGEELETWRWYLQTAVDISVTVGSEIAKHIENEFVQQRQGLDTVEKQQESGLTTEDLARNLAIARMLSASLHEKSLSIDTWNRTLELDSQRRKRL